MFGTAKLGDQVITTNVAQLSILDAVHVYPNPSTSSFNIIAANAVQVKVFDNLGRNVEQFDLFGSHQFGADYAAGIYHVMLINTDGVAKTVKMIKEY